MTPMRKNKLILEAIQRGYILVKDDKIFRKIKGSNCKGYRVTTLYIDGIKTQVKHHRIIWLYYKGPYDAERFCINHKNGNRQDNRIDNLELVTFSENNSKARNGKIPFNQKVTISMIKKMIELRKQGKIYKEIANEIGIRKSTVCNYLKIYNWSK